MNVKVIIERGKDGLCSAYMDYDGFDFGLAGFGDNATEAIKDFYVCYEEIKEIKNNDVPELNFEFSYDTASFLQYYNKKLSLAGLQTITGINRKQLSHYLTGHRRPSQATIKKIQTGLHKFSEEIGSICLI